VLWLAPFILATQGSIKRSPVIKRDSTSDISTSERVVGWGGCVAQGLEGLPHKPESLSKVQDHIVADRERVRLLYTLGANSHRTVYGTEAAGVKD
jgi:hypothetical protein